MLHMGLKKKSDKFTKNGKQLSLHTATNRTNEQNFKNTPPKITHKRVQIGLKNQDNKFIKKLLRREKKVHFLLTSCIRTSTVKRSRGNESSSWELDSSNSQASLIILLRHLSFSSHFISIRFPSKLVSIIPNILVLPVRKIQDVCFEVRLGFAKHWPKNG